MSAQGEASFVWSVLVGVAEATDEYIDSIRQAIDAGYDHVYTHRIGDDQQALVDPNEEEILPSFE